MQLFRRPIGMATTNSTIESFNKIIKDKVTDFEKLSINNFILTLLDRVGYFSRHGSDFFFYRVPNSPMT